jgi:hypothetical protein
VSATVHSCDDSCTWASDHPGTDSTFPNALQVIDHAPAALHAQDARRITAASCAPLDGYPDVIGRVP